MALEKGDRVAALTDELTARSAAAETSRPHATGVYLDGYFKEVDLGFIAHPMNQRYLDFCLLALSFPQVLVNRGQADLITFFHQGAIKPDPGQPLFRGRPWFPFSHEFFQT